MTSASTIKTIRLPARDFTRIKQRATLAVLAAAICGVVFLAAYEINDCFTRIEAVANHVSQIDAVNRAGLHEAQLSMHPIPQRTAKHGGR